MRLSTTSIGGSALLLMSSLISCFQLTATLQSDSHNWQERIGGFLCLAPSTCRGRFSNASGILQKLKPFSPSTSGLGHWGVTAR